MFSWLNRLQGNRLVLLIVVYIALFVDFMLTTSIVPIAPNYLFSLWYPNFTDATTATILRDSNGTNISDVPFLVEEERLTLLNDENIYVSTMFASKAVMQIIANPFVGRICDRIGYSIPMFCGFVVTFFSTVLFAFSKSYAMLFIARAIQGIGSACASTAGFGMLAMAFPDDEERGTATSKALGGLALGVLLGPMFGGILYTVQGIELPYLLLAGVAVLDGLLQVLFLNPRMERPPKTDNHGSRGTRLKDLLKDPYVWVVLGSLMLSNIGIALVEPALPIYMLERWDSSALIQGLIFLPCSGIYLVSTTVFGKIGNVIGRWLTCMLGHFFIGFSLFLIPFMPTAGWISVPMAIMGFSIGMTDTSNFAEMPRIVDIRHTASSYGYIYALSDMAISVAFAAGPLVGGPLVTITSFKTIVFGVAFSSVLYCPVLLFNRRIKPRALEQQLLLEESPSPSVRSVSSDYCRTIA